MNDYNGWTNNETWNVNLWANNDYGIYMRKQEWLSELSAKPTAEQVKEFCSGIFPDGTGDMTADTMKGANWPELAEAWEEDWQETRSAE